MKRVLVIDDEVAVLRHFMVLLTQGRQYEITILSDSTEALEAVGVGKFDVVLLDMAMPGVHGREVLRGIREHHPETAVIVITGVEDDQLAVEAMELGAFDYLYKPVGEEQLMLTMNRALETCASGRGLV